ncbi:hypothetical protein PPACK8108_LOCUS24627 [Phakopsora pachyrhizi]|uniref:Uncharacterized protein n=1 Tax=Phakopsora pachyrhizi TaxID=170000 RepID=A0AAV0BRZ6_PHAPC|nr:hypothetical protein PPACK8108_LOCUS24627 [Phakopsora pachyrhizi]
MPCQVLGFEDHLEILATPSLKMVTLDKFFGHADGDDGLTLEERQELELDAEEMGLTQLKSGLMKQLFKSSIVLDVFQLPEVLKILNKLIESLSKLQKAVKINDWLKKAKTWMQISLAKILCNAVEGKMIDFIFLAIQMVRAKTVEEVLKSSGNNLLSLVQLEQLLVIEGRLADLEMKNEEQAAYERAKIAAYSRQVSKFRNKMISGLKTWIGLA